MGLVCTVAIMGDPEAFKIEDINDGSLLVLSCMQQVMANSKSLKASVKIIPVFLHM